MPRTSLLKEKAYGGHLTSFDMTMFYYGIKLSQDSKKYNNGWFNGRSCCHNALPMDLRSSPFFAQLVSEQFSQTRTLLDLQKLRGSCWGSDAFPFTDVEQFRIVYIDDLLIHTLKELGLDVHFMVIRFVLFCVTIAGENPKRKNQVPRIRVQQNS